MWILAQFNLALYKDEQKMKSSHVCNSDNKPFVLLFSWNTWKKDSCF